MEIENLDSLRKEYVEVNRKINELYEEEKQERIKLEKMVGTKQEISDRETQLYHKYNEKRRPYTAQKYQLTEFLTAEMHKKMATAEYSYATIVLNEFTGEIDKITFEQYSITDVELTKVIDFLKKELNWKEVHYRLHSLGYEDSNIELTFSSYLKD